MRSIEEIKADISIIKSKLAEGYTNTDLCELQSELRQVLIYGISTNRLEEICKAESDGRLVIMPFKFGEPVFVLDSYEYQDFDHDDIQVEYSIYACKYDTTLLPTSLSDKEVFKTREEAEEALKEKKMTN